MWSLFQHSVATKHQCFSIIRAANSAVFCHFEWEMWVICYLLPCVCLGGGTQCWHVMWRQSSCIKWHSKQNITIWCLTAWALLLWITAAVLNYLASKKKNRFIFTLRAPMLHMYLNVCWYMLNQVKSNSWVMHVLGVYCGVVLSVYVVLFCLVIFFVLVYPRETWEMI